MLALVLPTLLLSRDDFTETRFHILLLSSLYGVGLLMSSDSFLTMFLGIEIMSLPVYVLVLLGFQRPEGPEAALKYLVLSSAATATFLMGVSLLYGGTGTLELSAFSRALGFAEHDGASGGGARRRRLLPEGGDRPLPRLGTGRLRRRKRAGDRVHGNGREGRLCCSRLRGCSRRRRSAGRWRTCSRCCR